ncbi:MAG TPA: VOC family protein [Terriglobales bacterium]|jgi:catechol 2,3-dioxygenase-like lactoylglutathione lyase family enzyme|nr:VOC family protein [Terriglobales bacterium]
MIAHVGIQVSDIEKSKKFYTAALAPLGYRLIRDYGSTPTRPVASASFGEPPRADFWIYQGTPTRTMAHIAFLVGARGLVAAFYTAALAADGRDNGQPGLRPQYSVNYYSAFVLDPDGYNIEVVCREAL